MQNGQITKNNPKTVKLSCESWFARIDATSASEPKRLQKTSGERRETTWLYTNGFQINLEYMCWLKV
jgi:hypothetical protein